MTGTVRDERRRRWLRDAIVALVAALVTPSARAHAIVESSEPAANAVVAPGDLRVRVRFGSRIDAARSRLTLIAPDGRRTTLALDQSDVPGMLTATAQVGARGRYTLQWQVLSVDGHVTRGDIPFRVDGDAAR
jgi:methionine-rich copper-binding protein CopC